MIIVHCDAGVRLRFLWLLKDSEYLEGKGYDEMAGVVDALAAMLFSVLKRGITLFL